MQKKHKTNKEFEEWWNMFCRKVRFICCCGCDTTDPDLPEISPPTRIEVNQRYGGNNGSPRKRRRTAPYNSNKFYYPWD